MKKFLLILITSSSISLMGIDDQSQIIPIASTSGQIEEREEKMSAQSVTSAVKECCSAGCETCCASCILPLCCAFETIMAPCRKLTTCCISEEDDIEFYRDTREVQSDCMAAAKRIKLLITRYQNPL